MWAKLAGVSTRASLTSARASRGARASATSTGRSGRVGRRASARSELRAALEAVVAGDRQDPLLDLPDLVELFNRGLLLGLHVGAEVTRVLGDFFRAFDH